MDEKHKSTKTSPINAKCQWGATAIATTDTPPPFHPPQPNQQQKCRKPVNERSLLMICAAISSMDSWKSVNGTACLSFLLLACLPACLLACFVIPFCMYQFYPKNQRNKRNRKKIVPVLEKRGSMNLSTVFSITKTLTWTLLLATVDQVHSSIDDSYQRMSSKASTSTTSTTTTTTSNTVGQHVQHVC